MRWSVMLTLAALAVAFAAVFSGGAGAQGNGPAQWVWTGQDSDGGPAKLIIMRDGLAGLTIDIEYRFNGDPLCLPEDNTVTLRSIPVRSDAVFAYHAMPQDQPFLIVDIDGRFDGKQVSGTARASDPNYAACNFSRQTGTANFSEVCEPCGEGDRPAEPTVSVLTALPSVDVKPRTHANGRIVFARTFKVNGRFDLEVATMSASGGGLRRLTRHAGADVNPRWSPNGDRIAFERQTRGSFGLWIMSAAGRGARRIATDALEPSWSPDGRWIAFRSFRRLALWAVHPDGSGRVRLLNGNVTDPVWSPDGHSLLFETSDAIWALRGSTATKVRLGHSPAWSPDGSRIAAVVGDRTKRLVTMSPTGANRKTVAHIGVTGGGYPSWSPDGRRIIFQDAFLPHPYQELSVVSATGGAKRRLTNNFEDDTMPDWGRR